MEGSDYSLHHWSWWHTLFFLIVWDVDSFICTLLCVCVCVCISSSSSSLLLFPFLLFHLTFDSNSDYHPDSSQCYGRTTVMITAAHSNSTQVLQGFPAPQNYTSKSYIFKKSIFLFFYFCLHLFFLVILFYLSVWEGLYFHIRWQKQKHFALMNL